MIEHGRGTHKKINNGLFFIDCNYNVNDYDFLPVLSQTFTVVVTGHFCFSMQDPKHHLECSRKTSWYFITEIFFNVAYGNQCSISFNGQAIDSPQYLTSSLFTPPLVLIGNEIFI